MISVTVHRKSQRVLLDLGDHPAAWDMGVRSALHEIGALTTRETQRLIAQGPKTGRVYIRRGRRHQASAPGEPPANETGRLRKSVGYQVRGTHQLAVGEEAPYAAFLEHGTRRMAPRPHLLVAANNTARSAVDALGRNVHARLR